VCSKVTNHTSASTHNEVLHGALLARVLVLWSLSRTNGHIDRYWCLSYVGTLAVHHDIQVTAVREMQVSTLDYPGKTYFK
jgi:hypothetical protein